MAPMNPGAMPDLSKIDDSQLDMMKNMMNNDSGRKMMRDMFKSQYGMDMSEDQLNMMSGMMNKETLKMAAEQMKSGGMQMPPGMQRPYPAPGQDEAPVNRGGSQGGAMEEQPPGQAPGEMMKGLKPGETPGMETLVQNKGMIKMMVEMIKTNPAMLRGICGQLGESHPVSKFIGNRSDDDLKRYAVWIGRGAGVLFFCYPAFAFLKKHIAAVGVLIVAFIVYKYIL
jgi:hypothetical protein